MDLNEDVLKDNGGAWNRPPARVVWGQTHKQRRDEIIGSYSGAPVWGFKDPRTLLTLDGWREALPTLSYVGTFRHPMLVARSLKTRDGGSLEQWVELWASYNERLLELYDRRKFPIVDFDAPEDRYFDALRRLGSSLGLTPPQSLDFYTKALRHHRHPGEAPALTGRVGELYERLRRIAFT